MDLDVTVVGSGRAGVSPFDAFGRTRLIRAAGD
jgi:hypothetical protein